MNHFVEIMKTALFRNTGKIFEMDHYLSDLKLWAGFSLNEKRIMSMWYPSSRRESKESLKELAIATLKILSAACGGRYSESDILNQVSFVITDSTAHNIGVMDEVCEKLKVESKPSIPICHIHPLLMMQRKVVEAYKEIHDALGPKSIKECFLVNVEFRNQTIVERESIALPVRFYTPKMLLETVE